MNHDLFTWENFQTFLVGALAGVLRALSARPSTLPEFLYVLSVSCVAGGIAALFFGPALIAGIVYLVGDRLNSQSLWLVSGGIMGVMGVTTVAYLFTAVNAKVGRPDGNP